MPAPPQTFEQLLALIERSGLLPEDTFEQKVRRANPPRELVPFAKWLVKTGLMTTFQVDQLLQGKSRGFFLGKYRILKRLGGGATAGVFLGEHQVMRNRVAIKVLSQALISEDQKHLDRFRREARAAAGLSHPNIVRTLDFDEDEGRYFLVMEYVEGVTLDQWLKQNPTAPARVFVRFIMQAAHGLQHVHESGLIHRDIKPCNLLIDKEGTLKILDLGLAKFTDDRQDNLSQMQGSNIMGTVDFMSPEQADGSPNIDIRTDIYSLGATLYYLLTGGELPFAANTLGAKMIAIQFQLPRPIGDFNPSIDPLLEKIVLRMMSKDPGKRYASPREMIAALESWLNRSTKKVPAVKDGPPSIKARKVSPKEDPVPAALPVGVDRVPITQRKWFAWGLRAVAFLIIVTGLAIIKPWGSSSKATAETPPANSK